MVFAVIVGAALLWLLGRSTSTDTASPVLPSNVSAARAVQMTQAVHPVRAHTPISSAQRPSANLATKGATATAPAPASTARAPVPSVVAPTPSYAPAPTYQPPPPPPSPPTVDVPAPVYVAPSPPSPVGPTSPRGV